MGLGGAETKDALATLRNLKISGTVLVVLADDETIAGRSFANLPNAHTTSFGQLSAHDVLRSDWILFSARTLPGSAEAAAGAASAEAADPAPEAVEVDGVTDSDTGTQTEPATETETEEATTDA